MYTVLENTMLGVNIPKNQLGMVPIALLAMRMVFLASSSDKNSWH